MVELTYSHRALAQLHDDIQKLLDCTNKKKGKKKPVVVPVLEKSNRIYTSYKKKVDEMRVELEKKKNKNALDEPDCDDTNSFEVNKCRTTAPTKRQLENYNRGVEKLRKLKLKEKREQEKRMMQSESFCGSTISSKNSNQERRELIMSLPGPNNFFLMNIYKRLSIITERQLMWYNDGVERLRCKNGLNPSSSSLGLNCASTLHPGDISVVIERKVRVSNEINSSAYELELLE
ncbi:predicted protein [Chaetoceros tenuissimus]|uniref:Uncharacterized protein n=1 Tax=Chaetoceros tenuissimus TaxID=426638 RepID=A0AAD3H0P4_9STRA|nr:predicted protein [Chaetoceros tenuissimus]